MYGLGAWGGSHGAGVNSGNIVEDHLGTGSLQGTSKQT